MSSSFQSTPAPTHVLASTSMACYAADDIAIGCECADPALQIDCWGQEGLQVVEPGAGDA